MRVKGGMSLWKGKWHGLSLPVRLLLKQRYNGYRVEQYNVIIDVLGGYSKHLEKSVRKPLGARARSVLERMQKSVISNTLNIARTFKINT